MRRLVVLLALSACSTPSGTGPSDDDDVPGDDDGAPPDADPTAPDADPTAPDGPGPDGPPANAALAEIVPPELFEQLFPHRGDDPCEGAFYTYDAFLAAAARFPAFAATGNGTQRRREVAAFLGNASHETTGGGPSLPDGPHAWGLCWVEEGPGIPRELMADYCVAVPEWPCATGEKYYGRGPMQLSYNFNYGPAGIALGADLLDHPGLVSSDAELSFAAALWFWMTPQSPKPSCHDVMTGGWSPSAGDTAAGRVAGFGLTVDIINGGVECGRPTPATVVDRIAFYERAADLLDVTPGDHLDCATMQPY